MLPAVDIMPFHSLEEMGILKVSGGQTYSVMAQKILPRSRNRDYWP